MSTLMFSHGAEHLFVVLFLGHLILVIIYKLFKLYTGAAGLYKSLEEAHSLCVCGILSFTQYVSRNQVPHMVSLLLKGYSRSGQLR